MPLRVFCPDESAPIPKPVYFELRCDGDHGLCPTAPAIFTEDNGIDKFAAAMRAGWKETYTEAGDKRWLGPCCSGKSRGLERSYDER